MPGRLFLRQTRMLSVTAWLVLTIFAALGVVAYTYLGYPLVIWTFSRLFGQKNHRPDVEDAELPHLSLIVAAYNEVSMIKARIENALQMDYPAGKLEIIIASDGSSDGTNDVVKGFAHRGVRLMHFEPRRGKAAVLNDAIPAARGQIVMLSDANTFTETQAARQLAAWFADTGTGAVCGKLVLTDPENGKNVDGLYWKYETFLKMCESRLGALLGSNGGIYAIRKSTYVKIPDNTYVDDFVIPLLAKEKHGIRIVFDHHAKAYEETPANMASEFHRRARIGAGGFQAIGILRGLLNPAHGWVCFTFLNHKVLRWIGPFLLLYALLANTMLIQVLTIPGRGQQSLLPELSGLLALQVLFYVSSLFTAVIPNRPRILKLLRLPAMFTLMNVALGVGFYRWMLGRQKATWKRTIRSSETIAEAPATNPDNDLRDITDMLDRKPTVKHKAPVSGS